jgi:hypothetical protein
VFANVLPGLRELRAPLAAGYLWLTLFWLAFADTLPTKTDVEGSPLERLYELEPVVSDIGKAVVVSVAAYMVGSVAIDAQGLVRKATPTPISYGAADALEAAIADAPEVQRWYVSAAAESLRRTPRPSGEEPSAHLQLRSHLIDEVSVLIDELQAALGSQDGLTGEEPGQRGRYLSKVVRAKEMRGWLVRTSRAWRNSSDAANDRAMHDVRDDVSVALDLCNRLPSVSNAAAGWINVNRVVVKTRLLDLSPALHSEVDRPDAEATFRMALWPPLGAIALYLAFADSPWWALALVLPVALGLQWIALRRRANDALVTAIAAKPEIRDMLIAGAYGTQQQPTTRAAESIGEHG